MGPEVQLHGDEPAGGERTDQSVAPLVTGADRDVGRGGGREHQRQPVGPGRGPQAPIRPARIHWRRISAQHTPSANTTNTASV